MLKIKLLSVFILMLTICNAQNVGINNPTPTEPLDVNGNVNIAGQLKLNGNAGQANQVLMKNGSNAPTWTDLSEFKNMQVYDNFNFALTVGANNITTSFVVPTGVTTILAECWGGGGGGGYQAGGGGGGYISAKFTVTAGASISITTGAGGSYGSTNLPAIGGGTTSLTVNGAMISAGGGTGAIAGNIQNSLYNYPTLGGGYLTAGITNQFIGFQGNAGSISKVSFNQVSATEFAKVINFGNGGDAAMLPGSGGKGGYSLQSITYVQNGNAESNSPLPGGGGGADGSSGFPGRGGRVIIRW